MLNATYLKQNLGDITGLKVTPLVKTKRTALLPFYLESIGDYDCDESFFVDRCGYNTCLLIYTLSGEGRIRYEEEEYTTCAGELIVLNCNRHQYYATKGERWHFLWLHINGKCAFDYTDLLNITSCKPLYLGNRILFQTIYEKLRLLVQRFDAIEEMEISLELQMLFTNIIRIKGTQDLNSRFQNYKQEIGEIIAYMQQMYQKDLTVEHLAERCHLSKSFFSKVFKAYTGHTPYDFLLEIRLKQVQKMLLETTESIAEIAKICGFADSKNLIFHFKKCFTMTPLQYRKLYRISKT